MKNKNRKIYATLVLFVMVATAVPSVSATTIGVLSTVTDNQVNVLIGGNVTSDDISEMIGLSLSEDDTFYVSYYNETGVLTHTSFAAYEDAEEDVWFNATITDMNATCRQMYFDDAALDADNYDEAECGLYVNESVTDEDFCFIATIPDGVTFTYGDYSFLYDDGEMTVLDDEGEDAGTIDNYNYSSEFGVYGMNYTDEDSSHQIVFVADSPHDTATTVAGKRVTKDSYIPLMDTTEAYSMKAESTADYDLFTSEDGYVAFDVYNDYGDLWGKYLGGHTAFRMTTDTLKYEKPKYYGLSHDWVEITTSEAKISGIGIGLIQYIYVVEGDDDEPDSYIKENYGVIVASGSEMSASGLSMLRVGTKMTPKAIVESGNAKFI